jgi:drug/metabolite transporter (DMT)-like permease
MRYTDAVAMTEKRKGEFYIFSEVFLWGFFPIVTVLSYGAVSAVASFAWSTFFAALFFAVVLTYRGRWSELRNPIVWKYSVYIALLIGVLFYGCYFLGLQSTTAGNAALMALFEVCTAFVFFSFIGTERYSSTHIFGAICMIAGALIILAPNFSGFRGGDILVLAGTLFTPAGNYYQQKARALASSETIMFLRSILSLPFIALLGYFLGSSLTAGISSALPLLIFNGVILFGVSKFLWIEGIHRVPVPKAIALQTIDPLLTIFFAWLILAQAPTLWQLLSLAPFALGVLLLTDQIRFSRKLA